MGLSLRQAHVLLTGGSRGIGLKIARALAAAGARLTLVARTPADLQRAAAEIAADFPGVAAATVTADLRQPEAAARVVATAQDRLGPVAVLVNNAGVYYVQRAQHADLGQWDDMIDLNLRATMRMTHAVLPGMLAAGAGAVVNIASVAGLRGYGGNTGYCASKFGVVGFGQALREDVQAAGIQVTTICPGLVRTDMTASLKGADGARMLAPEDVAAAVLYALKSPPHVVPALIEMWPRDDPYGR